MPYWRLSSFYFSYFFVVGVWMPFCALYFSDLGYSTAQIGLLVAMMSITRIIAPNLWGWLADKTQRRMTIVKMGLTVSLLIFIAIYTANSLAVMIMIVMGYTFFLNAVMSQFDVLTLQFLGDQYAKYGRVRLWGSLGFVAAVLVAGKLFDIYELSALPHVIIVGLLVASIIPWTLKEPQIETTEGKNHPSIVFVNVLKQPSTIAFLCAAILLQLSHAPYYTFFSIYLEGSGYSRGEIGFLWALAVMAEVVMFTRTHSLLQRFSVRTLMLASLWIAAVRWTGTGLMVENLVILLFLQTLHAFTFAVFHAASVDFVRQHFPVQSQGQAQSLLNAAGFGAGAAIGAYGSGMLWDSMGMMTYFIAAIAAAAGALAIWYYIPSVNEKDSHATS